MRYATAAEIDFGDREPSRYAIDFSDAEDKTLQSFKDDADINNLVRRFKLTGQAPMPNMSPFYGDFTQVEDYQSAMNMIIAARESFHALPAEVRKKFNNDPAQLIEYLNDPKLDKAEARKLGLLKPEEAVPAPQKVMLVDNEGKPVSAPPGPANEPSGSPAKPQGPGT